MVLSLLECTSERREAVAPNGLYVANLNYVEELNRYGVVTLKAAGRGELVAHLLRFGKSGSYRFSTIMR